MPEPNYEGNNAYLADLNSREMSNSETYDNALLARRILGPIAYLH